MYIVMFRETMKICNEQKACGTNRKQLDGIPKSNYTQMFID